MSDNKKNREELKNYFRKGNVPTEEHFALLIDSVVNIVDDKPLFATDMPENESLKEDNTEERIKPEQASETSVDAYLTIPADGDWYQLPVESAVDKEIDGCRIYRVYASCYNKRDDSYDLCVATASHCSGNDRKILSPSPPRTPSTPPSVCVHMSDIFHCLAHSAAVRMHPPARPLSPVHLR